MILRLPLIAVGCSLVTLVGCQGRIIYHPSPYPADLEQRIPAEVQTLGYETSEGHQVAFWLPPRSGVVTATTPVWMCFTGNADLSLSWLRLARHFPAADTGFLFVDYPGFGRCSGSSTPGRILASSDAAVLALAAKLEQTPESLRARIGVLGHSLGAAAALQYAAAYPTRRVVVVSPFTTMVDMASRIVGWPLSEMVWHRFNNRARLGEIIARPNPPPVIIIHGGSDDIIPTVMGRTLAADAAGKAVFHEIPGADHNGIISDAEDIIIAAMVGGSR